MFRGPVAMIRLEEKYSSSAGSLVCAEAPSGTVASKMTIKSEARKKGSFEKGMAAIEVSEFGVAKSFDGDLYLPFDTTGTALGARVRRSLP